LAKENSADKQNINSEFKNIQDELKDLEKDNAELKSPVDLPDDAATEKSIAEDLKKATDELRKIIKLRPNLVRRKLLIK
jgi:predicted nuclease with TOPRIM domain